MPLKDAYDIINRQNRGMITLEEFILFSEIARHEEHFYYILAKDELFLDAPGEAPIDREIVHENLVDIDLEDYYNMVEHQYGKPLYIPTKQELLKYNDDLYIPDTPQTKAMNDFFRKRLKMSREKAEDMVGECILISTCADNPIDEMFDDIERMRIRMTEKQVKEFAALFSELHNNTRLPVNRGFTPNELAKKYGGHQMPQSILFGPNITESLKNGEMDIAEFGRGIATSVLPNEIKMQMLGEMSKVQGGGSTTKKVGRNDPCPYGSGKKYKK